MDEKIQTLIDALKKIEKWELPTATERDGTIVTYGQMYGSAGERDYIRQVAKDALKKAGVA